MNWGDLMKKLILVLGILALVGCTKDPITVQNDESNEVISTSQAAVEEEIASSDTKNMTPVEAKKFITELFKKINDDEKFVLDAYELKEQATLEKYFYDVQAYMQPNSEDFSDSYWIDSEALAPYTKCDTALRDLQLYANALSNQLKDDTATMRKIVRQEEEDYKKSKSQCEERLNLTYEQALAADEAE